MVQIGREMVWGVFIGKKVKDTSVFLTPGPERPDIGRFKYPEDAVYWAVNRCPPDWPNRQDHLRKLKDRVKEINAI